MPQSIPRWILRTWFGRRSPPKETDMSKWLLAFAATTLTAAPSTTFYKDVLPILQARCQECHRAGEIGPMAFTAYKEVRPWAKAIREVIRTKKMPPWFADAAYGHFSNDRSMSQTEIDT